MQKAPVADNKKYSSKIIDCCEAIDELADDLYLMSCVDITESEQMNRISQVLKRKTGAIANRLDRQSSDLGELLECEDV